MSSKLCDNNKSLSLYACMFLMKELKADDITDATLIILATASSILEGFLFMISSLSSNRPVINLHDESLMIMMM